MSSPSAGISSLPSAFTVTIRRCRSEGKTITGRVWVYVRDDRPSQARGRRRRCSSTHAIATVNTPPAIWLEMPASCRPMPMPGSVNSTRRGVDSR